LDSSGGQCGTGTNEAVRNILLRSILLIDHNPAMPELAVLLVEARSKATGRKDLRPGAKPPAIRPGRAG
jgi:hypothetical protein